ncbi:Efflux pump periplasmic linker BepF [Zhongshania aliphaticivorans]|uniref:Efflux pump periplasmic linker BepF n=1 Tax=Zhongshania aliphaticivorans TaxID=1470434 RepID=A0A5S9QDT9_9GAMM|nr:efflux RND transporter periplasmic adaptor subunit [Zhongshania aliphaticivorans]CAA0087969.1 Efflux pump periplasmic linker BepF [Zhongshania aliphaticivorans]CAA0115718.1 Efflux pump periplasmic linker BepF [Zhongshania aliphaticivorans]CAA0120290.1 Efflux pump periplasmic linker BepF [Zhongshania aliphaticivorans]
MQSTFVQSVILVMMLFSPSLLAEVTLQRVSTTVIERLPAYEAQRLFAGRVIGSQRADIGFELAGKVAEVTVEDGQQVNAGEVLARLDTRSLVIEKAELIAAQSEVTARLEQLEKDVIRFRNLRESGYVSVGQLDELISRRSAAAAQLSQVDARLKGVALRMKKSQMTAPFSGEVSTQQVEEGVLVSAGQALMQVVVTGNNEAVFGISDRLGRNLVYGQPLSISGDFGVWPVSVISVAQNLDWRTQTRTVRVQLPPEAPAVDGNTTYLHLPEKRDVSGFWVPLTALLEDVRGTWAVYGLAAVDDGSYQLRKRSVQPVYQYQGRVYVDGELQTGDRIVTAGLHRLSPGLHVSLMAE